MSNKEKAIYTVRAVKNGFVCRQYQQAAVSPAEAIATVKRYYAIAVKGCKWSAEAHHRPWDH